MKIEEIRYFLKNHQQYFSNKNNCEIENIKSQNKYYFIADCGHEFDALPTNVFVNNELRCPICSGKRVLKGFNDLWTTHPELAKMLVNSEDGYLYSYGSNQNIQWKCNVCGNIFKKSPMKMVSSLCWCNVCNDRISYGEKYISSLLLQLKIDFIKEHPFNWSNQKRYDFYLPDYNCIIETHGKQHYIENDFSGFSGGKTYIEEIANDEYKQNLATENGIEYYIIIDCLKSESLYIQNSIKNSIMPTVLQFNMEDIDFKKCENFCMKNITQIICDYYNNHNFSVNQLAKIFNMSPTTIRNKLKIGTSCGLCNYDAKQAKEEAVKENGKRIIETMSKTVIQLDLNNNYINTFSSIQDAQRILKASHIWDVIVGRRCTAGGFKWMYKEDYERVVRGLV